MSLEEKHRTLLFADDLETSRLTLGACRFEGGKPGEEFVIPGRYCDDDDPATGNRITGPVGRFGERRVWDGQGDPSRMRAVEAMVFPELGKTRTVVTWNGQNFAAFCTQWENQHSPLVAMSPHPEPTVVVDSFGQVVAYYLKKVSTKFLFATDDGEIFYMSYLLGDPTYSVNTKSIAGDKIFITPADKPVYTVGKIGGYQAWMKIEKWADVLVDIDGFVVAIHTYGDKDQSIAKKYNDAVDGVPLLGFVAPRLPNPNIPDKCFGEFDEDMVGYDECAEKMIGFHADSLMLLVDALTLGGSKSARKLLEVGRKTILRKARSTAVALTLYVRAPRVVVKGAGEAIRRIKLPDGRLADEAGLRVTKGYDEAMGVPKGHFTKMVAAAKEADGIAVFRANKGAAIPLIEKGAHPKPKHYNAFKTSKETGVLTAKEPAHIKTAYQHGDYVVDDDLVPRRIRPGHAREQLTIKNPYWKLEKGQVIKPDGKPIVGDYDLLGFLPNKSPGRIVNKVPDGHVIDDVKGDWVGPDVKRYQDAINSKFDQPRVLHGAQDGFQHSQYGGLTDDVAYAVYGNGSAVILNGRQAQEAFYAAYGRQTARGQYPRPSPGTPVVDELAARRARKQGSK